MRAADTSIVVAAFASWHEHHAAARRALDGGVRPIKHCALETYSVLTRLPPAHRSPGAVVRDFIRIRFPQPFLRLRVPACKVFVLGLPSTMSPAAPPARPWWQQRRPHRGRNS